MNQTLNELAALEKDVQLLRRILRQSKGRIAPALDAAIPAIFDALDPKPFVMSQPRKNNPFAGFFDLLRPAAHSGAGSTAGSPNIRINVVNNANAAVNVSERPDGRGGMDIEILIDQIMAQSLARPGSQSSRLMQSLFGLSPLLSRR